jgi:hypothetical protein
LYDQHDPLCLAIGLKVNNPHKSAGADFALRLAVFYAALCFTQGVQMPLLPIWLAAKGLDARMIGIVLAGRWSCAFLRSRRLPWSPIGAMRCARS